MAIGVCNSAVDPCGRELTEHGTSAFPIAYYNDDLSNDAVPWHWHDELEVAVVTKGCAVVSVGNEKYTVRAGEGIFINSGILHGAWNGDTSCCEIHSMVFHPRLVGGSVDSVFHQSYVQPLMEDHTLESVYITPIAPMHQDMLASVEAAWQNCVSERPGYEFKVRNALSELIFLLQTSGDVSPQKPSGKTVRDGERIKAMLTFIHESFADELDTKQIAGSAAISESECLRCFKITVGTTPIQYLRQYRIRRAADMLVTTQDRIADIAAICGFQDISYFTKTFREIKGYTPREYRRINTKQNSVVTFEELDDTQKGD